MSHYIVLGTDEESEVEINLGIVEKVNAETALHAVAGGQYPHYRVVPIATNPQNDPIMFEFDAEDQWDEGCKDE